MAVFALEDELDVAGGVCSLDGTKTSKRASVWGQALCGCKALDKREDVCRPPAEFRGISASASFPRLAAGKQRWSGGILLLRTTIDSLEGGRQQLGHWGIGAD